MRVTSIIIVVVVVVVVVYKVIQVATDLKILQYLRRLFDY